LVTTIHVRGSRFEDLGAQVEQALVIYTMAANGGMTVDATQEYLKSHWRDELDEFVSASVHSLIGRLFAIKAIEDSFCIETTPPLIPSQDWIFHTDRLDKIPLDALPEAFFGEMAGLAKVENPAVRDLAATGRFYDWLAPKLDPAGFRRLLTLFFTHNFARLDEDLLGRFFETRGRHFTFFPAAEVVSRVDAFPNVLHGESPRRVFIKKWPGLITAFDELFRADTRADLSGKIEQFFAAVALEEPLRETALDRLAGVVRATSVKSRGRLSLMAMLASEGCLQFDPAQIKRVVTGSAPNEVAWYPDQHLTSWIYYEPRLRVPRNVHEGRNPGYGTMSQWRDSQSHLIDPKFVFTTGTNPDCGLKAFVLPGDWMVKLHGGESQQFHYTGLVNPLAPTTFSGPNNLGDDARVFYESLISAGHLSDDFLFYLAGIYNSQIAEDYLEGGGGNVLRIPLTLGIIENGIVGRVITLSRRLRNLHWVGAEARDGLDSGLAESLVTKRELQELALREQVGSGGRFQQRPMWHGTEATGARIDEAIARLRPQLDEAVNDLFIGLSIPPATI
jgi:hypothetical protein